LFPLELWPFAVEAACFRELFRERMTPVKEQVYHRALNGLSTEIFAPDVFVFAVHTSEKGH
jgi:hypothetical protein